MLLRKFICVLLLAIVFWNAIPKNYFHSETEHHHSFAHSEHQHQKGKTEIHDTNACNFNEYDVYTPFLFAGISELQAVDVTFSDAVSLQQHSILSFFCYRHFDLRAPPLA